MRARKYRWSKGLLAAIVVIAVLLVSARVAAPYFITRFVNQVMSSVPGFQGHVEDVDLHLYRGAYTIHGMELTQKSKDQWIPVLKVPTIDFSIEWRALRHGAVVAEVEFHQPRIDLIAGEARKEGKGLQDLTDRFLELTPIQINRFALIDAQLHFRNFSAEPDVDIYLDQINLEARNLTNSLSLSESLAATVEAQGRAMRSGEFKMDMKLDPFQPRPTFELAFELKGLQLPELNNFLRHYLAVVARDGEFAMFAESKADNGRFKGYVKPMVRDLDVLHIKEKGGIAETIKGFFVKIIDAVFKNQPEKQLASKIEFSGSFENPDINIWEAVASFLRNAFVRALEPGVEGTVTPEQAEQVQKQKPRGKEK